MRFRYLGPGGGEVEVDSLEGLRALMESGTVGELTLLYDVLTGEWAPARAHAVFRLLLEEEGPEGGSELPDLGLTVSFQAAAPEPDPDRAIRSLLREREEDVPEALPLSKRLRRHREGRQPSLVPLSVGPPRFPCGPRGPWVTSGCRRP